MYHRKDILIGVLVLFLLLAFSGKTSAEFAVGSSMSSDNFRILDSQQLLFGGTASISSPSFNLVAVIGNLAIGSGSLTSFSVRNGFLYYPKVVAPTLNTATAGDAQVTLLWTAAQAFQGWSIGGYDVCTKPSAGSYTCQDVGSVTTYIKTGLSNGTTYTFKLNAKDALGNIIAISNEKSATPTAATPPPGGGGGGGGGGYVPPGGTGTVIIRGTAYPSSTVTVSADGMLPISVRSGTNAKFEITMTGMAAGQRTIGISSEDLNGRKSITSYFVVTVIAGSTIILDNVFLAPTIDISALQLNRGEILRIFGQAQPVATVDIHVQSEEVITKTITDSQGAYAIRFDTAKLIEDEHITKSRATFSELVSPFSKVLQFVVGRGLKTLKTADLNKDGRVNIIDFSILLFWWNTKQARGLDIADINDDGKVNVVDFSIMLFQWTG